MDVGLGSEPPDISQWEIGTGHSIELSISAGESSIANPNLSNEHVGVDDECLHIDIGPEHPAPLIPTSQSEPSILTMLDDEIEDDEVEEDGVEDDECLSDDEIEEDDIVTDREPPQKPDANYDSKVYSEHDSKDMFLQSLARVRDTMQTFAYITSISGAKLEDYVDECYLVDKFKIAYEGSVPSIPDKSMWPKPTHGFFMHPLLLKATAGGRRKTRMKSALEKGSSRKKSSTEGGTGRRQHECPICHQLEHHWYICKNGNPDDIAAMEAERGPPKKKQKKASFNNTETSIVATPASGMVFPHNEAVANATPKPKRAKKAGKKKGPPPTSAANLVNNRSRTGSNDPFPLQLEPPPTVHEDIVSYEVFAQTVQTPRKKRAVMKKYTPKRPPVEVANPSSLASNTRSKKKLHLE